MSQGIVFVLNKNKQPLDPTTQQKARKLLKKQKAVIHKMEPFTIRLKELKTVVDPQPNEYRLKIDYGSRYTGLAILRGEEILWLGQLHHKIMISKHIEDKAMYRRGRRNRKTRYRPARFLNRKKEKGWVPPSLQARVDNIESIVKRFQKLIPLTAISYELVKFDTQLMTNPNIKGVEYQQGTLFGYEVKEYLLQKFNHVCMYCGVDDKPLEVEHIHPKSRGGTNRIDNLGVACTQCNKEKNSYLLPEWAELLKAKKDKHSKTIVKNIGTVYKKVDRTLKEVAIVNATRFRVLEVLKQTGLPVECGTGGRTKMNRLNLGLPKDHHFDAICVGASTPETIHIKTDTVHYIKAMGRGRRNIQMPDKYGFPKAYKAREKIKFGFQTGDIAKGIIPKGKYKGTYTGRITIKTSGVVSMKDGDGNTLIAGSSYKYFKLLQKSDGYHHSKQTLQLNQKNHDLKNSRRTDGLAVMIYGVSNRHK